MVFSQQRPFEMTEIHTCHTADFVHTADAEHTAERLLSCTSVAPDCEMCSKPKTLNHFGGYRGFEPLWNGQYRIFTVENAELLHRGRPKLSLPR